MALCLRGLRGCERDGAVVGGVWGAFRFDLHFDPDGCGPVVGRGSLEMAVGRDVDPVGILRRVRDGEGEGFLVPEPPVISGLGSGFAEVAPE